MLVCASLASKPFTERSMPMEGSMFGSATAFRAADVKSRLALLRVLIGFVLRTIRFQQIDVVRGHGKYETNY